MAVFVMLPRLNADMDCGDILAWQKSEGDMVYPGDVLFKLQAGTKVLEVEAANQGALLAVMVAPGARVPVDMPVAILGDYGEPVGPMVAEARVLLGDLMISDAVTGATEKFKLTAG